MVWKKVKQGKKVESDGGWGAAISKRLVKESISNKVAWRK